MDKSIIGDVFEENYEWFKRFLKGRFIDLNDYDVEDIIQQTAMKLLYKGENLAGIKNMTSYIYTALQNGAKDYFKKSSFEFVTANEIERETESLENEILRKELKEIIFRAIESLNPNQKYVFVETEIKGRSYAKLAIESGEKIGTLLSRKNRAIKNLRENLETYINKER